MKRTNKTNKIPVIDSIKKLPTKFTPEYIITGDIHLREDHPVARTDDFQKTQWRKIQWIKDLQFALSSSYGVVKVICSGDLFENWKPSPYLLSKAIKTLPSHFQTIYGNHDLPQHSLELAHKCGVNTLMAAEVIDICSDPFIPVHWGEKPDRKKQGFPVWHVMTYVGENPIPGGNDPHAVSLLKKYPEFKLIITGHNHKPFVAEYEGRYLINPGSPARQTAAETHTPRVYLYDSKKHQIVGLEIPHKADAVSRDHLEVTKKKNKRIEAFVTRLDGKWEKSVSFEDNLEAFESKNEVKPEVRTLIQKAIEE